MKKILMALTALALLVGFTGCENHPTKWGASSFGQSQVDADSVNEFSVTVINKSGDTIDEFYVSATSSSSWGADRTGNIADGASPSIVVSDVSCVTASSGVDLIVGFASDTNYTVLYDQQIECGKTYEWSITGKGSLHP